MFNREKKYYSFLIACYFILPCTFPACRDQQVIPPDQNTSGAEGSLCQDNDNCATNLICFQESCRVICQADQDCSSSQKCLDNICLDLTISECQSAADCTNPPRCHLASNVRCLGGKCLYQAMQAGSSCNDGNECTQNDACDSLGVCSGTAKSCDTPPAAECINNNRTYVSYSAQGTCNPNNTTGCDYQRTEENVDNCEVEKLGKIRQGATCGSTPECASGLVCVDGVCCNSDCLPNHQCINGRHTYFSCTTPESSGQCTQITEMCTKKCNSSATMCSQNCSKDEDCPASCTLPNQFALYTCNPTTNECTQSQVEDCYHNFKCEDATTCLTECQTHGDCIDSHYCLNGNCVEKLPNGSAVTSSDSNQCQSGFISSDNYCCNNQCQQEPILNKSCIIQNLTSSCSTGECKITGDKKVAQADYYFADSSGNYQAKGFFKSVCGEMGYQLLEYTCDGEGEVKMKTTSCTSGCAMIDSSTAVCKQCQADADCHKGSTCGGTCQNYQCVYLSGPQTGCNGTDQYCYNGKCCYRGACS